MKSFVFLILIVFFGSLNAETGIEIIPRSEWGARKSRPVNPVTVLPVSHVVVHHSATRGCQSLQDCKLLVKSFQNYHMDEKNWSDIAYNFLIDEKGRIYEGRGWDIAGSHAKGYNFKSVGIALIGNFSEHEANESALESLRDLIAEGVAAKHIAADYGLIGHRQAQNTECPGDRLFREIKRWPHWLHS